MNTAYLITTTGRYHDTRAEVIRKTWGRDVEQRLLFLSDAPGPTGNYIDLGVPSDYDSAPQKLVSGLLHFAKLNYRDFDWVFICDDDTFVFTRNLEIFLQSRDPQKNECYCFVLENHPTLPKEFFWPSGGAGYALSRAAFEQLLRHLENCTLYQHTDVTIGMCLRYSNTVLISTLALYEQEPEAILERGHQRGMAPHEAVVTYPFSFHRITPELMRELYRNRDVYLYGESVRPTAYQDTV